MKPPQSQHEATLRWQLAMGAEDALEETPRNRYHVAQAPKEETVIMVPRKNRLHVENAQEHGGNSPRGMEAATRAMADKAETLEELRKAVTEFKGLSICKTAINTVFSDGMAGAPVMFIGEAPGANEDEQGIPFCGASGQLMDRAVSWIGLKRDTNWYISNTVFWRPPGNRKPTKEETSVCRPFVEKHIALAKPKLIVLVGGTATASLWDDSKGITRLRGTFGEYTNQYLENPVPMTALFHPSFLLRSPSSKKQFWFDLLEIREFMRKNGGI